MSLESGYGWRENMRLKKDLRSGYGWRENMRLKKDLRSGYNGWRENHVRLEK
jgi:hypothetical protein